MNIKAFATIVFTISLCLSLEGNADEKRPEDSGIIEVPFNFQCMVMNLTGDTVSPECPLYTENHYVPVHIPRDGSRILQNRPQLVRIFTESGAVDYIGKKVVPALRNITDTIKAPLDEVQNVVASHTTTIDALKKRIQDQDTTIHNLKEQLDALRSIVDNQNR